MQLANCSLVYNEFKSSVPKKNITPAEAQFLVLAHSDNAGQIAVVDLVISKETVKRTSAEEKKRLSGMYIHKHDDKKRVTIESIWPGVNAQLPERFDQIVNKDGEAVFGSDGKLLTAVPEESMTIAGKVYSRESLEKLVAGNVKVVESDEEDDKKPASTIKK